MADDDYGDEGYFFGDDDYLYVEDEYAIADELAESQIPSPGYAGTANEIDDGEDYDMYEYFGELEYGDDCYWDSAIRHLGTDGTSNPEVNEVACGTGVKRKRDGSAAVERKGLKRRKTLTDTTDRGMENVVYKRFGTRLPPTPPRSERRVRFALLPDWEERFCDMKDMEPAKKNMPVEMQRAAEGRAEEEAVHDGIGEEGEWEDDREDNEDDNLLPGLDPTALKAIMKQKLLEETGLELDGDMLDKMIQQMLSGSADDAAGSIAEMMLGQAGEAADSQASKWLAGKGVRLDEEADADNGDEPLQSSQLDSTIGLSAGSSAGATTVAGTKEAVAPNALTSRKRKTSSHPDTDPALGKPSGKRQQSGMKPTPVGRESSSGKRKK